MNPMQMFFEGGTFMYVLLFLAGCNGVVMVAQIVWVRRLELGPLIKGFLAAIVATGGLGAVVGMMMALRAVAVAAPEIKQTLMAQGLSVAMITVAFALLLFMLEAIAAGVVGSMRATVMALGSNAAEPS
jgi:hypothetical protein